MESMNGVSSLTIDQADIDFSQERDAIIKCQNGDRQAFGYLVKKYMQRAYYIALGFIGSHESANDLSQEAFLRAYRAIKRFDPDKRFFTWYYQILRNLCFNFNRDKARHARPFSEIEENQIARIPDAIDTEKVVERNETRKLVWEALNELKPKDREIIVLKDFQDLSYKEIAEMLSVPIGTVMSRLYYARAALKAKLERKL